jgi:hypothetical protein
MITKAGSKGIDESGVEYDHGFTIEIGRVHYTPNADGTFETNVVIVEDGAEPRVEVRDMSAEDLQKWFDNPTPDYYESNIKILPTK